jgi:hypothetical protein
MWKFLNLTFTFAPPAAKSARNSQHPVIPHIRAVDFFYSGIHFSVICP